MGHFFAKYEKIGSAIIRNDTRVYLNKGQWDQNSGDCIGVWFLNNPGESNANRIIGKWVALDLNCDNALPNILNMFKKATADDPGMVPHDAYIKVCNCLSICDPDVEQAIRQYQGNGGKSSFNLEEIPNSPAFVTFGWGNNPKIHRFAADYYGYVRFSHFGNDSSLVEQICFFPDKVGKREVVVRSGIPQIDAFPKHTQGLKHDLVVPEIRKRLIAKYGTQLCA